jgi:hypothetical protein
MAWRLVDRRASVDMVDPADCAAATMQRDGILKPQAHLANVASGVMLQAS